LIVVDTSALIAIVFEEPDADRYVAALSEADAAFIAPVNYVEAGVLFQRRGRFATSENFGSWLAGAGVEPRNDLSLSEAALDAYIRFGKGFHPARLNLADCFAYALAKALDAPLLYKGDDFAMTDIRSAVQPT
jgi:ribonuclease VapC